VKANVISFLEVEDIYDIMYTPREAFIVNLAERDVTFEHRGNIADFACDSEVHVAKAYTKAE
jgi:hypothetical protein